MMVSQIVVTPVQIYQKTVMAYKMMMVVQSYLDEAMSLLDLLSKSMAASNAHVQKLTTKLKSSLVIVSKLYSPTQAER